jgi:hypothetical protein
MAGKMSSKDAGCAKVGNCSIKFVPDVGTKPGEVVELYMFTDGGGVDGPLKGTRTTP